MATRIFLDGPEYVERTQTEFHPPDIDMQALKDAIPKIAFQRSTPKSLLYTSPIFTVSAVLFFLSRFIDSAYLSDGLDRYPPFILLLIRWTFWLSYWALQGIAWAGLWTIGEFLLFTTYIQTLTVIFMYVTKYVLFPTSVNIH